MSDLRAGLRALITEYGRDGGNDDIDNVLDRAIALIQVDGDGLTLSHEELGLVLIWRGGFVMSGIQPVAPDAEAHNVLARRLGLAW